MEFNSLTWMCLWVCVCVCVCVPAEKTQKNLFSVFTWNLTGQCSRVKHCEASSDCRWEFVFTLHFLRNKMLCGWWKPTWLWLCDMRVPLASPKLASCVDKAWTTTNYFWGVLNRDNFVISSGIWLQKCVRLSQSVFPNSQRERRTSRVFCNKQYSPPSQTDTLPQVRFWGSQIYLYTGWRIFFQTNKRKNKQTRKQTHKQTAYPRESFHPPVENIQVERTNFRSGQVCNRCAPNSNSLASFRKQPATLETQT